MDRIPPLFRLKRNARRISRAQNIPLHMALDQIAVENGYQSWNHLAVSDQGVSPALVIYRRLKPGDLLLTGARPGQGKTLFSLQLAVEAIRDGHRAYFFSLEYTSRDVVDRLRAIGVEQQELGGSFIFDDSDDISAGYVIERLATASPGSLVVIDYLQLLDQRRDKPDVETQVVALKALARRKSLRMVFISQIDRTFDTSSERMPGLDDVRLPNPLDLSLFDRACFLNGGDVRMVE